MPKRALKKSKKIAAARKVSRKTMRKSARKIKPKRCAKRSSGKKGGFKKVTRKPAAVKKGAKHVGVVTHFFTNIRVAIVKFNKKIPVGTELRYEGATTNFTETVKSMQYDHEEIKTAPKGKQVGIKVKKRVRDGDKVYIAK